MKEITQNLFFFLLMLTLSASNAQVANYSFAVSDIENLQIGANYPSEVYNVIVSQGLNTQTLRLIKR